MTALSGCLRWFKAGTGSTLTHGTEVSVCTWIDFDFFLLIDGRLNPILGREWRVCPSSALLLAWPSFVSRRITVFQVHGTVFKYSAQKEGFGFERNWDASHILKTLKDLGQESVLIRFVMWPSQADSYGVRALLFGTRALWGFWATWKAYSGMTFFSLFQKIADILEFCLPVLLCLLLCAWIWVKELR